MFFMDATLINDNAIIMELVDLFLFHFYISFDDIK